VTVTTASGALGTHLTDGSGRTLYVFAPDTGTTSTCNGACASIWPPVPASGTPTASGDAKASLLGTSKRTDGTMQVTYAGHPLYTYAADTAKGDAKGQGLNVDGGLWWVVAADGSSIKTSATSGSSSMKAPGRY
jgi:predicted lipoprotein with Yx(FWY)xxD motif